MKFRVIITALGLAFGAGCATTGRVSGAPQEIHLYGVPVTLNLDDKPGPDGFAVRVYASRADRARGLAVNSGAIEFLAYDGIANDSFSGREPLKTWRFTTKELPAHEAQTSLGMGYRFVLRWDENKPARDHITVLARYVPKSGPPVYSAPSAISSRLK